MSELGDKQKLFVRLQAEWVLWVYEQGYELTCGDGFRSPVVFGKVGEKKGYGRSKSNHKVRLAHDWNLFKDGKYLRSTEAHRPLGEKWESMHPDCRWGGRYQDGNHYSMIYRGKQ